MNAAVSFELFSMRLNAVAPNPGQLTLTVCVEATGER
jgi:hypothetical protein